MPKRNDGKTVYRLTVKDVPVDGFWSVCVYNKDGFFEKNAANGYALNNLTAKKSDDGSITIQFGEYDGQDAQQPAGPARLELHGSSLSPAKGNPRRNMEVP